MNGKHNECTHHQGRKASLMNILLCNLSILATIGQKGRKGKNFERGLYIKKLIKISIVEV